MIYCTVKELIDLIRNTNKENDENFQTFLNQISKKGKKLPSDMLENIVDLLIFEHNATCDGDLYKLSHKSLKELTKDINKLARDYKVNMKWVEKYEQKK